MVSYPLQPVSFVTGVEDRDDADWDRLFTLECHLFTFHRCEEDEDDADWDLYIYIYIYI